MDAKQNMLIDNLKHKLITPDVISCVFKPQTNKYDITFKNGRCFSYSCSRITWLQNPKVLDPALYHISYFKNELRGIAEIFVFSNGLQNYWHIYFSDGTDRYYHEKKLTVSKSCLSDETAQRVLTYLKSISTLSNLKTEDGTKLLSKSYEKISAFIDEDTALAAYLNPQFYQAPTKNSVPLIFPFGCNASQYKAVKDALENQISVIQGPPGTGKTQTILNIIANLIIAGKTMQIVSNNEAAVSNIIEKLSIYNMDFLVAFLGKSENKKSFLENQTGFYPDLSSWHQSLPDESDFLTDMQQRSEKLNDIFQKQERLAMAKQELQSLQIELRHFEQYLSETNIESIQHRFKKKLKSSKLMQLWQECQFFADTGKQISPFFKIKSCIIYGISNWRFYKTEISKIVNVFQSLYYQAKTSELEDEITELENECANQNSKLLLEEFSNISMSYLMSFLYNKYGNKGTRTIFHKNDLWKNSDRIQEEYPIVLSTTFSSRNSLSKESYYDYLIMDEASQVDIATGALALSGAKNAVIVGDTKQLPNIVPDNIKNVADEMFDSFNISEGYRHSTNSFLKSLCEIIPSMPKTMLKEHYRCHPKIINFCNQKFYGGELVIMTPDNGEENVISVIKTVVGNHDREHLNQRQIDVVVKEVLPQLNYPPTQIGIIAPYNIQVTAFKSTLKGSKIDIATVHKFQGREKDAIVLSTVDNTITTFSDDPYLLNVAVSRAKKNLCLVISGNEQPKDSNISDLISYIEYNNFSVTESNLYSIFDYLYKQYTLSRINFLKKHKRISEYDSENLMFALIQDTLKAQELSYLDVICHMPLNMLIRNPKLLNDEECKYAMNNATHLDFLIYNRISKKPVLVIEVDGFHYHKAGTKQATRDKMKNHILNLYEIPYLRFATNGSGEKERLIEKLHIILNQ